MKAICEGRSTRNDVVQQNLEQYRAVFARTSQQIHVLKAVGISRRSFFSGSIEQQLIRLVDRPSESMSWAKRIRVEELSTRRAFSESDFGRVQPSHQLPQCAGGFLQHHSTWCCRVMPFAFSEPSIC